MNAVFHNARIIDCKGEVLSKSSVVVEGQRITKVGKDIDLSDYQDHKSYDISGKTLLPGFIDCHVHFCNDASVDPFRQLDSESPFMTTIKACKFANNTIRAGITTVRDMAGKDYIDLSLKEAIALGIIEGPRMICSGKVICMTGGARLAYGQRGGWGR